ncbi:MAG TPA: serine/threonine-protein kinase [Gemmatales bacterium]|nr:serine/threonine-protein kinase [Gemmatales bacterium]HMP59495.1 serine/threonine-protein kinase [Gemmatales bacterium]
MAVPTTSTDLIDLLHKSELVERQTLEGYLDALRGSDECPGEATKLASRLVNDGLVTYFQAKQLLKGRYRGFTLGKYKVLEILGTGGMGNVYLCEHITMKHRAAVKVVPTEKARQSSMLARFQREARAVAALNHPNIVRAFDLDSDNQFHYLVMEYVDGVNLQKLIKRHGPLSFPRVANYLAQAAEGLQYLHDNALVHRDLKPSNLLLDRQGVIKILDFGLARFMDDEEDTLTQDYDAHRVLGTADYLSPEQIIKTHDVDIRSDIYSLGVTTYFLLTGQTPFESAADEEKLILHQTRMPTPLVSLRPDTPPSLVAVVERMMAKKPLDRFQTPIEIVAALEPWLKLPVPPPPESEIPPVSLAARTGSTTSSSWGRVPALPATAATSTPRSQPQIQLSGRVAPGPTDTPRLPITAPQLAAQAAQMEHGAPDGFGGYDGMAPADDPYMIVVQQGQQPRLVVTRTLVVVLMLCSVCMGGLFLALVWFLMRRG